MTFITESDNAFCDATRSDPILRLECAMIFEYAGASVSVFRFFFAGGASFSASALRRGMNTASVSRVYVVVLLDRATKAAKGSKMFASGAGDYNANIRALEIARSWTSLLMQPLLPFLELCQVRRAKYPPDAKRWK